MPLLFVLFLVYSLFNISPSVTFAQSSCASISNVSATISSLKPNSDNTFECNVTVDSAHAGTRIIACGLSINGSWPENFCPSNTNFNGWRGNIASYRCSIPAGKVKESDTVELVGFDFSGSCGPDTGKRFRMSVERQGNNTQPQPTSSQTNPQPTTLPQGPTNPDNVCANIPVSTLRCRNNAECTIALIKEFLKMGGFTTSAPLLPTPTPPPIASELRGWQSLCSEVGLKTGIAPDLLCAMRENETGNSYTSRNGFNEPIEKYFKPGAAVPEDKCPISSCSDTGPMQITTGIYKGVVGCRPYCKYQNAAGQTVEVTCVNTWKNVADAVNEFNPTVPRHEPNPCNFRDNVYAAAKLLKIHKDASPYKTDEAQTIAFMIKRYWGVDDGVKYDRANDTHCGPRYAKFNTKENPRTYCWWILNKLGK